MGTSIPIGACEYYSTTTTTPPAYNNSQTRATSTSPLLPLANTVRAVYWKLKPRISTLCKQTKLVEPRTRSYFAQKCASSIYEAKGFREKKVPCLGSLGNQSSYCISPFYSQISRKRQNDITIQWVIRQSIAILCRKNSDKHHFCSDQFATKRERDENSSMRHQR